MSRRRDSKSSMREFIQRLGARTHRPIRASSAEGGENDGQRHRYTPSFSNHPPLAMVATRGRSFLPRARRESDNHDDNNDKRNTPNSNEEFLDGSSGSPQIHSTEGPRQGQERQQPPLGDHKNASCGNTGTVTGSTFLTHPEEEAKEETGGQLRGIRGCVWANAALPPRPTPNDERTITRGAHRRRKRDRMDEEKEEQE